jgi:hypothetical protein
VNSVGVCQETWAVASGALTAAGTFLGRNMKLIPAANGNKTPLMASPKWTPPRIASSASRFWNLSAEKHSASAITIGVPMVDATCCVYPERPLLGHYFESGSLAVTAIM